jgi:hypothetical protein
MNKQEAIKRFKDACNKSDLVKVSSGDVINRRESAVKHQFARDVWDVNDDNGRIRICENPLMIVVFNTVKYVKKMGYKSEPFKSEISQKEYDELKAIYFGDFKEDKEYLEKWKKIHIKNLLIDGCKSNI